MHHELACAARFLTQTMRLDSDRAGVFAAALAAELEARFAGHWHPARPHRGSGFRALHHTRGNSDAALARAARAAGVALDGALPPDLTLWIDPSEVSVRVGERGGVFNLPLHEAPAARAAPARGAPEAEADAGRELVGRYSPAGSPRSLSPRTSPRISHALPILDASE